MIRNDRPVAVDTQAANFRILWRGVIEFRLAVCMVALAASGVALAVYYVIIDDAMLHASIFYEIG